MLLYLFDMLSLSCSRAKFNDVQLWVLVHWTKLLVVESISYAFLPCTCFDNQHAEYAMWKTKHTACEYTFK